MFPLMEPLEGQLVKEEGGEETRLIGILYLRLGRASPKTGQYLSYQIWLTFCLLFASKSLKFHVCFFDSAEMVSINRSGEN